MPEPAPDSPTEDFEHGSNDVLVKPVPQEGSHSFSQQVPECASVFSKQQPLKFVLKTTLSHYELITIHDMEKALSHSRVINCPPFTVDHHGYKICPQIRLDEHLSFAIAIMKADEDKHLVWPFSMIVILRVINQSCGNHRERMFRCVKNKDRLKECLTRPKGIMNAAMGYPQFMSHHCLVNNGFIRNNCMQLECYLFPKDALINHPSEVPSVIR